MAEFRINISGLSEGFHNYDFETEPSAIGLDETYVGLVKVHAQLEKSKRQIMLRVEALGAATMVCDRCLEDFEQHLETKYQMLYVSEDRSMDELEDSMELQLLAPDANYIDLDEDVRQYLILAVPQKLLCSESCLGLCPVCGANRNETQCQCNVESIDSRWESLQKLSGN
ncbi:MAG: DUF177 domain-containing protein [Bacteroidetes bacterium]|nr:DUF177 domain-containing protein [Bacteroidota bacterium]